MSKFSSYDQLLSALQSIPQWHKMLLYHDFKIVAKYTATDARELDPNEDLPSDLPRELFLELGHRGFSSWKPHEEDEVLSYIGAPFRSLDYLPSTNSFISPEAPVSVEADHIDSIVQQVKREIEGRLEVVDMESPLKLTCREFIALYIVGSMRLIRQYLRNNGSEHQLSLVREKFVCGLTASGPIDYVIALDMLDIVFTTSKPYATREGLLLNLLQQHASLEFMANAIMGSRVKGLARRKRLREDVDAIRTTCPTFGIVSNGTEWIFTKCWRPTGGGPTEMLRSEAIYIDYRSHSTLNDLEPTMRRILFVMANLMMEQIGHAERFASNKRFQGITPRQLRAMETTDADEVRREECAVMEGDDDTAAADDEEV